MMSSSSTMTSQEQQPQDEKPLESSGELKDCEGDLVKTTEFDWIEYFDTFNKKSDNKRSLEGVPESSFQHVEASLEIGIKEGHIVEHEWDSENKIYWLATVESVHGPLIGLRNVGEDSSSSVINDKVWLDISNNSIHPLGWCRQEKMLLEPPNYIKSACLDWKSLSSQYLDNGCYKTIPSYIGKEEATNSAQRLKIGSIIDLQDDERPYCFWPVKVSANFGGLLTLEYYRFEDVKETLFYTSNRLFPGGHVASAKGCSYKLPSVIKDPHKGGRGPKVDIDKVGGEAVPSDLIFARKVLKHKFDVGYHLEMIHPINSKSLDRCVVDSVIDDTYFIVKSVTEPAFKRFSSMLDPTIFPCGTCKSLRSLKGVANVANASGKVVQKRNFPAFKSAEELGFLEQQKLLVLHDGRFRSATILESRNHLLVLQLDGGDRDLILKSALSLEIFPTSWCLSNGVPLWIPKSFSLIMEPLLIPKEEEIQDANLDHKDHEDSGWCDLIFFNHKCYPSTFFPRGRIANLPKTKGPGPVQLVMQSVLTELLRCSFKSPTLLRLLRKKEGIPLAKDYEITEFKAKSKNPLDVARIQFPSAARQVISFLRRLCKKVGACPNLISTTSYPNGCPEDCRSRPKTDFERKPKILKPPVKRKKVTKIGQQPKKRKAMTNLKSSFDKNLCQNLTLESDGSSDTKPFNNRMMDNSEGMDNDHTLDSSTHSDQDLPISKPPAIRSVELHTNPETWGPRETAIFLSQTSDCSQLSDLVLKDAVDGPTFLMLNYSIAREYWNLDESMAIQLCQHVESVRQAHLLQFL